MAVVIDGICERAGSDLMIHFGVVAPNKQTRPTMKEK